MTRVSQTRPTAGHSLGRCRCPARSAARVVVVVDSPYRPGYTGNTWRCSARRSGPVAVSPSGGPR
jgi:hypothetical protein